MSERSETKKERERRVARTSQLFARRLTRDAEARTKRGARMYPNECDDAEVHARVPVVESTESMDADFEE